FAVSGQGLVPERVTAGATAVKALRLTLRHTGAVGESPAAVYGLTLRMLDQLGQGIPQNSIISAIRVESPDSVLCSLYPTVQDISSYMTLAFAETVLVESGDSLGLDISLDLQLSASPGYFQVHLNESALEIFDGTSGIEFNDLEGTFPLSSGLAQIILPADRISFGAQGTLPANIVPGQRVKAFSLHFERGAGTGGSPALLDYIKLDFSDENDGPIDIAGNIEEISLENGSGVLPTTMTPMDEGIKIEFDDEQRLGAGESLDFDLYLKIFSGSRIKVVSATVGSPSAVCGSDEMTGDPVAVDPVVGSQFPFYSGRATILAASLQESFSNYPNPFVAGREKTRITFYMPDEGTVTLQVFTILGRLVKTLAMNERRSQGPHQDIIWDGRNGRGEKVINGVYYLVLKAEINGREQTIKRKAALVR
ncbi:MAG: hypothetical protein JXB45_10875, partial [Candidatus Krumholzibacteriota bacterium]|nr:hypothetical protein [Candidatus Krumholzibacteriota bacterium]